jgi:hypothetical protein
VAPADSTPIDTIDRYLPRAADSTPEVNVATGTGLAFTVNKLKEALLPPAFEAVRRTAIRN